MKKSYKVIILVFVVSILVLSSFFIQSLQSDNDSMLKTASLKLSDLNEDGFKKYDENHQTERYIAPNGTLFSGKVILEKYSIRYNKNDYCFIMQTLGLLESEDESSEFLSKIKSVDLNYDFTEINVEEIGEETFIGKNTSIVFGNKTILYFVVFRIDNYVVALLGSMIHLEDIIDYAKIVETNIKNELGY